jgi:polyisoprenoid-binding protein YceI
MGRIKYIFILFAVLALTANAQGFKVKASGLQRFNFEDKGGRNHVTFFSATPLEDITGTANGVSGFVSFDPANFARTLKGIISVSVASMSTGIKLRDEHLCSDNWLNEKKFPDITFEIKEVTGVKQVADNKLEFKVKGNFTLHGVMKEVTADAEATYLEENEQTVKRAPGDLFGVRAKFNVRLSDYGVENAIIGNKVAENIEVSVNIVGSNKS